MTRDALVNAQAGGGRAGGRAGGQASGHLGKAVGDRSHSAGKGPSILFFESVSTWKQWMRQY